ncbi:MAG: uracil-DNA glycosylase [Parvibaculales bacterium]
MSFENNKNQIKAPYTRAELIQMMRYQFDIGVDETLTELPQNRYQAAQQALEKTLEKTKPQKQMREAPATSLAPPQPSKQTIAHAKPPANIQETDFANAQALADAANDIDALKKAVMEFDACPLKKQARNTVFSDGNPSAKIMLIGEAPGKEEDKEGKPFIGMSGKLLDKMLSYIGLERDMVYITNILPWRPPGNRAPRPDETALCLPFVKKHIELIKPELILLVGGTSAKELLQTPEGITKLRGKMHVIDIHGTNYDAMAMLHPAYLLRNPIRKAESWQDLLKVKQFINAKGMAKA